MGAAPSIPSDSSPRLQVIGAGLPRTGTVSLALAIEKLLAGPVSHGGSQLLGREDAVPKKWLEVYKADQAGDKQRLLKLLKELTAGFVGLSDSPPAQFIPELLEIYPDAKVVLVTRDPERWWQSMGAVRGNVMPWWLPYFVMPMPGWRFFPHLAAAFEKKQFETYHLDRPSKELIVRHNEWVRSVTPKDRLLEMQLGDGWAPLCTFFNKSEPKEPFPKANDAEAAEGNFRKVVALTALVWTGIFATAGAGAYGAWYLWNKL